MRGSTPKQFKACPRLVVAAMFIVAAVGGCSVSDLGTIDRFSQGLVIVLPGMEGRSAYNVHIARGLEEGGVPAGIEIYDWGLPFGSVLNVVSAGRNHKQAEKLADRIVQYRQDFPGRPVVLIAHSAGAGVAVLALEDLPPQTTVKAVYLLAPAISPEYDLSKALRHTDEGIWNYYSGADVFFLGVGTAIVGTVDRRHHISAGAIGFNEGNVMTPATRELYNEKLHEIKYDKAMARSGNPGSHTGWSNSKFVAEWIAPLVLKNMGKSEALRRRNGKTIIAASDGG